MKIVFSFIIGCMLGFGVAWFFPESSGKQDHEEVVAKYTSYMRDAANSARDKDSGLIATDPPPDPMASLAALVDVGTLVHLDLVFPQVPCTEDSLRYWQAFVRERDDVVFASGNPSYVGFDPKGTQPLHLNIWFRRSASDHVRQLILDIDERWGEIGKRDEDRGEGDE